MLLPLAGRINLALVWGIGGLTRTSIIPCDNHLTPVDYGAADGF